MKTEYQVRLKDKFEEDGNYEILKEFKDNGMAVEFFLEQKEIYKEYDEEITLVKVTEKILKESK